MKIRDIVEKTDKEYCKKTPVSKMGASDKASCKSQGLVSREYTGKPKSYLNADGKRVKLKGKVQSQQYGNENGPSATNTG